MEKLLWFDAIAIGEKEAWFAAGDFNGFFSKDIEQNTVRYIGEFPGEKKRAKRLFTGIEKAGDKLFFAPGTSEHVVIYNIKEERFRKVPLKPIKKRVTERMTINFLGSIQENGYIYFIGCYYPAILRINVESEEIEYITSWVEQVDSLRVDALEPYFGRDVVIKDNQMVLASACADCILVIQLSDMFCELHEITSEKLCYWGIGYDGNNYWLIAKNRNKIVLVNPATHKSSWYELNEVCGEEHNPYFQRVKVMSDRIWLIPAYGDKAVGILKENYENVYYKNWGENETGYYRFHAVWEKEGHLYGLLQPERKVICLTKEDMCSYSIEMSDEDCRKNCMKIAPVIEWDDQDTFGAERYIWIETEQMKVTDFVQCCFEIDTDEPIGGVSQYEESGAKIYKRLSEE